MYCLCVPGRCGKEMKWARENQISHRCRFAEGKSTAKISHLAIICQELERERQETFWLLEKMKRQKPCVTHTHTHAHIHTHLRTHTRQWYNDYYTYSPPLSLPSLNLMIFRYTPLHGQKHAVT